MPNILFCLQTPRPQPTTPSRAFQMCIHFLFHSKRCIQWRAHPSYNTRKLLHIICEEHISAIAFAKTQRIYTFLKQISSFCELSAGRRARRRSYECHNFRGGETKWNAFSARIYLCICVYAKLDGEACGYCVSVSNWKSLLFAHRSQIFRSFIYTIYRVARRGKWKLLLVKRFLCTANFVHFTSRHSAVGFSYVRAARKLK